MTDELQMMVKDDVVQGTVQASDWTVWRKLRNPSVSSRVVSSRAETSTQTS
jgi:hypothetical protein